MAAVGHVISTDQLPLSSEVILCFSLRFNDFYRMKLANQPFLEEQQIIYVKGIILYITSILLVDVIFNFASHMT